MQKTYAFGEFVVRPAQRLLTRTSGDPIDIHAKAFDALICLVQHRGEIVSRAELAHTLWPKVIVEDNNLSQTIRALRRALGDAAPPYRFVTTVPRRGYQFIATVIEQPTDESHFEAPVVRSVSFEIPVVASGPAPPPESLEIRPRFTSLAVYFACVAAMALLATTIPRVRQTSDAEAPSFHSSKPVADTVVEGYVPSWPLPEVVACLSESARLMDPERCAAAFKSVQEAERRRKHGLYEG